MQKSPLAEIKNPEARVDEFEVRMRDGSLDEVRRTLLEAMADAFPPLRHEAGLAAAEIDDDAFDAVLRALAVGDAEAAVERAESLGIDGREVPAPQQRVRHAACLALRSSNNEETRRVLETAFGDESADVRYQALVSLHDLGARGDELRGIVERGLEDEDSEVVVVAAQIAAERGWVDRADAIIDRWRELIGQDRLQLALSLAELIGENGAAVDREVIDEIVEQLIVALEDEETIAAASQGLVQLGADRGIEPLKNVIKRWFTHPILKVEAAAALHVLGDEEGTEYLEESLDSSREDARGYALRLVGRLRIHDYFDELAGVARSEDYHADTAVIALADFGGPEARDIIDEVAQAHSDAEVRDLAADELKRLDE